MTAILGISAFYHDSAAALVVDGRIVAAAQEERFTRRKHDAGFPAHAVQFCLDRAGLAAGDLDYVAFYDKPLLKFERLLDTYVAYAPSGLASFLMAAPIWIREKLHLRRTLDSALGHAYRKRYIFTEHHESHAASAFYPSPFDEAAILTIDGVGEWATASYGYGRGNIITLTHELRFPHSLGLLYSAFTYFCGFSVNSGEYKLMGLAPYGQPRFADVILEHLIDLKEDGSFRMDMSFFNYCQGLTMTSKRFEQLFDGPPRRAEGPLTEREMDLAASIQKVTEEIMLRIARHVARETGMKKLCLAGGVALNCVANGRISREGPFDDIWIQPAAGDAGGALGAAMFTWHQLLGQPRTAQPLDSQRGSLLGPSFGDDHIHTFLDQERAICRQVPDDDALCRLVADRLARGQVVGWFQGPMEFGPRALGSRSLLGDPRDARMQAAMNLKVKFRESFRPFAPSVLRDHVADYFETRPGEDSPYMLIVAPVRESRRQQVQPGLEGLRGIDKLRASRSEIPAVTHVDYSARIQTVDEVRFPLYHRLLAAFWERTGCPVLVNTSFNLGWEPIVCTPADAYRTFMSSEIDVLCLGHYVLTKEDQPSHVAAAADDPEALLAELWCCPCGQSGTLVPRGGLLHCSRCGASFASDEGVPDLFWPQAVTAVPASTPQSQERDRDAFRRLMEHSRSDPYLRALNASIGFNTNVLVVGCGDGALPSVLAASCRRVVGTDVRAEALRTAEQLRRTHGLTRARFVRMNPLHPCFRTERFDVVVYQGDADRSIADASVVGALTALVRPGGFFVTAAASLRWHPDARDDRWSGASRAATVQGLVDAFRGANLEIIRAGTRADRVEGDRLFDVDHRSPGTKLFGKVKQTFSRRGAAALAVGRRPGGGAAVAGVGKAVYDGLA